MPAEILYILVLLATICIVFIVLKRPIYEAMFAGYVVLIAITGHWSKFFTYIFATTTNTLPVPPRIRPNIEDIADSTTAGT